MDLNYNDSVFINCPFDEEFRNNFEAIVFTVYRCGFFPVSALSDDNALEGRLIKIQNQIEKCRYGIHDISRVELNKQGFPRFNMPYELGIFFGAKRFGNKHQKLKNAIVFERKKYSYQNYISDLSGFDIKSHENDYKIIIKEIRNWFFTASKRNTIPGYNKILRDFELFQSRLSIFSEKLELERDNLPFNDLCLIIEEFLTEILNSGK